MPKAKSILGVDEPVKIGWSSLEITWKTLTRMVANYTVSADYNSGYSKLVMARQIVESEMRHQGYESEWRKLTEG